MVHKQKSVAQPQPLKTRRFSDGFNGYRKFVLKPVKEKTFVLKAVIFGKVMKMVL